MKTPEQIAAAIIQRANDSYSRDDQRYPPFAISPWDDRIRWSAFLQVIAAEVIAEELNGQAG